MGSVEARIDLGRNFELDLFFDGGHLGQLREETDLPSFRSSAGLGLRYITPVGPIGILYGFKLDPRDGKAWEGFTSPSVTPFERSGRLERFPAKRVRNSV